jgi:two-component system alkaline phosphatase synthesis response regulator PhoP
MIRYNILIFSVNNSNIEFYKKSLGQINYKITVIDSLTDFEIHLLKEEFDLIIADLDLETTDGITAIKELKLYGLIYLPLCVICSSKSDDFIQVSALDAGADNFISLSVNSVVFELKVKALLKRVKKEKQKAEDAFFVVDREQFKIIHNQVVHYLPRLEFNLLDLLFSEPNKVFSKREIAKTLWHDESVSGKRTIDIHIRNIRKELGNNTIKTFRGIGYSINVKK